ncbi:MAG: hypothetical protein V4594_22405 [Bacteroidota bacterium]
MENQENNTTETQFENPNVDPGFEQSQEDKTLKGREDKRENNIDANLSLKEMAEAKESAENNDALNYKNDREHGAFNPKNI